MFSLMRRQAYRRTKFIGQSLTNKLTSIIVKKNYFLRLIDRLRKIESKEDREKRWKRGRVKEIKRVSEREKER